MKLFKYWRQDVLASVVVSLVALPLCLGIALASGAPLLSGLIAGILGGLIAGAISGSGISVSGPAAGLTVIVINSIETLGSFEAFALAVFLAGLFQIALGAIKAGEIGNYFPNSVIKGMLAAIGIILILKQVPHALGYDAVFMGDESFSEAGGFNTFTRLFKSMDWFHPGAVMVTLFSFLVILVWEKAITKGWKKLKFFPSALGAILFSIFLNEYFKRYFPSFEISETHLVQLPIIESFSSSLYLPTWNKILEANIWITAVTLAIVGSLESLLSVEAADKMSPNSPVTSKNRELIAQGFANTASGFLGGLPITAVIVRTSANSTAGAKSHLSAMLHGVWLLCFVFFIPNYLNLIPLSSLAVILILVGFKLTRPGLYKEMLSRGFNQFIPFIVTILSILFTDLLVGIMIGMGVGFIFVIRSSARQSIVVAQDDNNFLIRFHKDVSFLQKSQLIKIFNTIPEGSMVVIDGSQGVFVDADIEEVVREFVSRSKSIGIKVDLKKSTLSLSQLFREENHG